MGALQNVKSSLNPKNTLLLFKLETWLFIIICCLTAIEVVNYKLIAYAVSIKFFSDTDLLKLLTVSKLD